jgi:hypothetical protein
MAAADQETIAAALEPSVVTFNAIDAPLLAGCCV